MPSIDIQIRVGGQVRFDRSNRGSNFDPKKTRTARFEKTTLIQMTSERMPNQTKTQLGILGAFAACNSLCMYV